MPKTLSVKKCGHPLKYCGQTIAFCIQDRQTPHADDHELPINDLIEAGKARGAKTSNSRKFQRVLREFKRNARKSATA